MPPVAVKLVDVPVQIVLLPVISHTGSAFTVNVLLQVEVQPEALVTVTLYVPATVKLLIVLVAEVYPPGPLQEYPVPPVAVKLVDVPAQMVLLPVITHAGSAFTVNVLLQVEVQPEALVTVAVYIPATVKLLIVAVAAVYPPGPLQV